MINNIGLQTLVSREVQRFTRVAVQTLVSPWINAILYIFIFGFVVGSRIDTIAGIPYIMFVLPGVLMLNIIGSAYQQTAFSLYFKRFARHIEELLVTPLSNFELLLGHIIGGIARAFVVGVGIYLIAILFGAAQIVHLGWFLFFITGVSVVFSAVGLLVGLWADSFEQLSVLNTFIITPLTYLGGMFNSLDMLPPVLQKIAKFNPFFYFVDGLRYSMTGVAETNIWLGAGVVIVLSLILCGTTWFLFKKGWGIRK